MFMWFDSLTHILTTDGLSMLNENGGLRVFFPRNSFVTNTTLTHTDSPRVESRGAPAGNDHIVCYGGSTQAAQVTWHNSNGGQLLDCRQPCRDCGGRCRTNGGVGVDRPINGSTDIHMYTDSPSYVNQDLECQVSSDQSAFIGVYLINGGEFSILCLLHSLLITLCPINTLVRVMCFAHQHVSMYVICN